MRVSMLPGGHGDCLWIEWDSGNTTRRILVDGGTPQSLERLQARIPGDGCHFELLVISHVDVDHIGGVLRFVTHLPENVTFGDVWFNGWKHLPTDDELGPPEGEMISAVITKRRLPWNKAFRGRPAALKKDGSFRTRNLRGDMTVTLLSPSLEDLARLRPKWEDTVREAGIEPGSTEDALAELGHREELPDDLLGDEAIDPERGADEPFVSDHSEANGSSIVLLLEQGDARLLLCGDAFPALVTPAVKRAAEERGEQRLRLDALKISHHASRKNIDNGLLEAVDCPRYLVSTNGAHYKHPHATALSRVVVHGGDEKTLCFNYRTDQTQPWNAKRLKDRFGYKTEYPGAHEEGLTVEL
jgi:hypothetical protein